MIQIGNTLCPYLTKKQKALKIVAIFFQTVWHPTALCLKNTILQSELLEAWKMLKSNSTLDDCHKSNTSFVSLSS